MKLRLLTFTFLTLCVLALTLFAQTNTKIYISSKPETAAKIGIEYTYQVTVGGVNTGDVIRYYLAYKPDGMKIDTLTGLIKWLPTKSGYFKVVIHAVNFSVSDPRLRKAEQGYVLTVKGATGAVAGVVKGDDGKPLKRISVSLYRRVPVNSLCPTQVFSALTDTNGVYKIADVDTGVYFAYAFPICNLMMNPIYCPESEYAPIWYKDSPTMAGATPIPVLPDIKTEVNIAMHKIVRPVPVVVSGVVTNTDGVPIKGALVVITFEGRTPVGASNGIAIDPSIPTFCDPYTKWFFIPMYGKAVTDSLGKYKIQIPSGGPYVAASVAKGYTLQFFKEKNNALEADKLTLKADSMGVDFKLSPLPPATANVKGFVTDSAGNKIPAKVILHPAVPFLWNRWYGRSVLTDSLGNFVFEKVQDGKYILQVYPIRGYLPAFYKAGACGVMSVKLADTVVVKTTDVAGLSVCVKKATTAGGGKLAGRIVTPDGKPISGVVVTAQSVNDLRSFAISDANGQYEITDLDAAIYTVTAEKVGFISTQTGIATIDYSRGMFESQINFQMTVQGATSVRSSVVSIPAEFKLNQNYPNPFNPSTEIRFSVPNDGKATLKVYNLIGQVVATLLDGSVKAGEHSAKFDTNTNEIPSGVYLYELRFEGMRLVNKMVLMK